MSGFSKYYTDMKVRLYKNGLNIKTSDKKDLIEFGRNVLNRKNPEKFVDNIQKEFFMCKKVEIEEAEGKAVVMTENDEKEFRKRIQETFYGKEQILLEEYFIKNRSVRQISTDYTFQDLSILEIEEMLNNIKEKVMTIVEETGYYDELLNNTSYNNKFGFDVNALMEAM